MKKALYVIIAILLAVIIFFMGVLINQKTNNSLIKRTEEVTKQATETSSSNAYITTEDHLAELSDSKKIVIPQMYCYAAYNSHVGNRGISVYCIDVTGFNSLKIDSVTVENINTGSYVVITGVSGTTNTQLYETSGADSSISTIDISNYDTINFTIDVQSTGQHGACMYINNIVIQ